MVRYLAKCHQCKQVFNTIDECAHHAKDKGHVYRPAYMCPGCSAIFKKCKEVKEHMKITGHTNYTALSTRNNVNSTGTHSPYPASDQSANLPSRFETFTCFDCVPGRQFNTTAALADHRQDSHKPKPAVVFQPSTSALPIASASPTTGQPGKPSPMDSPRCTKCSLDFPTEQALQKHYSESANHPRCKTCGHGFEAMVQWVAHKARCPPPGRARRDDLRAPVLSQLHCAGDRDEDVLSRLPEDVLGAAACGGRRLNMDVRAFTVRRGLRTRIGHGSLLHVVYAY
ncbi:hypothetical protein C8Q76DRAFT_746868 [Earliella scabrosa]|nr:hypothetical protein C8Q76DRAFT_746868 [Earliella scabrosa]